METEPHQKPKNMVLSSPLLSRHMSSLECSDRNLNSVFTYNMDTIKNDSCMVAARMVGFNHRDIAIHHYHNYNNKEDEYIDITCRL